MKMNNREEVKLFQGGRPFGSMLDLVKRLTNKIPNDLFILPEENLLNFELCILFYMQMNEERKARGFALSEKDLDVFYSLPLFLSEDFVEIWEKEKTWKKYVKNEQVDVAYNNILEEKKPSLAYLPQRNEWYKSIWNEFFTENEDFVEIILKNSYRIIHDYRLKRPVFYNDKAYENITNFCKIINAKEVSVVSLFISLFNFKASHTRGLLERFMEVISYNDGKFFDTLNNIFQYFEVNTQNIIPLFNANSMLVKAGILSEIDIQNKDYIFYFKNNQAESLWNHLKGQTLDLIGSKPLDNTISAIVDKYEDDAENSAITLPLSAWDYVEILEQCAMKLKMQESLKILISGKSGTGKTSMGYALLKENNYEVFYLKKDDERRKNVKSILSVLACIKNASLLIEEINDIDMTAISKTTIPVIILNDNDRSSETSLHDKVIFDYSIDVSLIPFKKRLEYTKSKIADDNLAIRISQQIKSFGDINKITRLVKTEDDWDRMNHHIATYNDSKNDFCSILGYESIKDIPEFKGYEHINNYFNIIYDLFKNPVKYEKLEASAPKGFIISGEPGTGKTLFVKHIAKKTKLPLLVVQTSLLVENSDKIKEVFDMARGSAPCILFFDEIDSLLINPISFGKVDTQKQSILNCMLSEIDGVNNLSGVIVLGTTNHDDKIAEAAKRSGRLSETIEIELPKLEDRKAIWANYLSNKQGTDNFDIDSLAISTSGFSGADICEAVNQASLYAVNDNTQNIEFRHIDKACEIILWGRGDKKVNLSQESLWKTSVHETGHAMLAMKYKRKVNRVTIIPRQKALGVTHILHDENKFSETKSSLGEYIEMLLAGIMAEKVIFKQYESGGSSDIRAITKTVHSYFLGCGFSETIGFLNVADMEFWSEKKKIAFEEECQEFINNCAKKVEKWLSDNIDLLTKLSQELLEKKSIAYHELKSWEEKISEASY